MLPSYEELFNLQRVNMSLSMFFQLDCEAFCRLAKVSPHNVMLYDMTRGQFERLLCSVQNKKKRKKVKETNKRERTIKIQLREIQTKTCFMNISHNTLPLISTAYSLTLLLIIQ